MAFIDLGSPMGFAVSGPGSEQLAENIGGVDFGYSTSAYEEWVDTTRAAVAPECGARVMQATEIAHPDDTGQLIANHPGSGSI